MIKDEDANERLNKLFLVLMIQHVAATLGNTLSDKVQYDIPHTG